MRVVLYEWCTSGGLAGSAADLETEGRMMLEALAADAARASELEPLVLVAEGRPMLLPARAGTRVVAAGTHRAALLAAAREAAWTVIVAPETDGILPDLVQAVRAAGGRVLAPAADVITITADKHATVAALASRGLPVPAGRTLAAGEPLPVGFRLPAVRKARASCGGDGLEVLVTPDHPAAVGPCRLETLVTGTPVGVACLCGGVEPVVLPPVRQRFSAGVRPRYLGGDLLTDERLAARARQLARRTVAALGAETGWLGVDLILGDRADGRADRILEVNPRPTTSVVLLARLFDTSLVAAMIAAATGGPPPRLTARPAGPETSFRVADDPPIPADREPRPCPTPT